MSNIEHPSHYNTGTIEVWDAIIDWKLNFLDGNVVKYVARADHKGKRLEDLKKAREYLNKSIALLEGEVSKVVDAEFVVEESRTTRRSPDPRPVWNLVTEERGTVFYVGNDHVSIEWERGELVQLTRDEFRQAFGKGLTRQEAWLKWNTTVNTTGVTSTEDPLAEAPATD